MFPKRVRSDSIPKYQAGLDFAAIWQPCGFEWLSASLDLYIAVAPAPGSDTATCNFGDQRSSTTQGAGQPTGR